MMKTARAAGMVAVLSLGLVGPTAVVAQNCRIHKTTGKCIFVPGGQQLRPDFAVGDDFPIYEHSMLMNIDRYGLPPVDGAWRYYKAGHFIYKVDANSYHVLEIVRTVQR